MSGEQGEAPRSPKTGKKLVEQPKHFKKGRVSPKLRQAMRLHIREGKTIKEACKDAGYSEAGWHKAMQRDVVRSAFQQEIGQFTQEVEELKAPHKARALEVGRELLEGAKSDAVRARMVEFFAGEAKAAPSVTVNVDARSGGYEYAHPGQRIVDITPSPDKQSAGIEDDEPSK